MQYYAIKSRLSNQSVYEQEELMKKYSKSIRNKYQTKINPLTLFEAYDFFYAEEDVMWRTELGAFIISFYIKPFANFGNYEMRDLVKRIFESDCTDATLEVYDDSYAGKCDLCCKEKEIYYSFEELELGINCAEKIQKIVVVRDIIHEFRKKDSVEFKNLKLKLWNVFSK